MFQYYEVDLVLDQVHIQNLISLTELVLISWGINEVTGEGATKEGEDKRERERFVININIT